MIAANNKQILLFLHKFSNIVLITAQEMENVKMMGNVYVISAMKK